MQYFLLFLLNLVEIEGSQPHWQFDRLVVVQIHYSIIVALYAGRQEFRDFRPVQDIFEPILDVGELSHHEIYSDTDQVGKGQELLLLGVEGITIGLMVFLRKGEGYVGKVSVLSSQLRRKRGGSCVS